MNCTDSRELAEKIHGKILGTATILNSEENDFEVAMTHMTQCGDCKMWFEGTLCLRVKGSLGEIGDDDYVIHRTLHDLLELSWVELDHQ